MKAVSVYVEEWITANSKKYYKTVMKAKIPKDEYEKVQQWKKEQELKKNQMPVSLQFAFMSVNRFGESKIMTDGSDVYSDKPFQIYVKPNQDCYFYVYNIDSTKQINRIFPEGSIKINNPLQKEITYLIPDGKVYAFDSNAGPEIFYVFAFKEKQNSLEEIIKQNLNAEDFEIQMKEKFSVKGIRIENSGMQINTEKFGKIFPETISGDEYIMYKMKFNHY
jgi:hypothetical protein